MRLILSAIVCLACFAGLARSCEPALGMACYGAPLQVQRGFRVQMSFAQANYGYQADLAALQAQADYNAMLNAQARAARAARLDYDALLAARAARSAPVYVPPQRSFAPVYAPSAAFAPVPSGSFIQQTTKERRGLLGRVRSRTTQTTAIGP